MPQQETQKATLKGILITEELCGRAPRTPDWRSEAIAMQSVARQMASHSQTLLQHIVDIALDLCSAGSAGVSELTTTSGGEEVFHAHVLAGTLAQYSSGITKRDFSPCGVTLERSTPQLFSYPERYFTHLQTANTPIVEQLVLPVIVDRHIFGTIWIMSHHEQRHFDNEDVRIMTSLADFTATALLLKQQQTGELLADNAAKTEEIVEHRHAQERLQAVISNLPDGAAFVVDPDLRYLLAEGEALAQAGFKTEDFVGRTIFEVLPPELAEAYEPRYRKALAGEPFEHEHNAHDHAYITRGIPLFNADGEVYAVLAVSYNITERKIAEAALRESEARVQAVANLVPDLLWESEPDGSTNWYNQRWMEYTGQTFQHAIGWGWIDAIHPDDRKASTHRYREAVEQGVALQQEHRIRRHNGEYRWFFVNAFPLKDEGGKVVKMYGAATDIHQQQIALEALRESEEKFRTFIGATSSIIYEMSADWQEMLSLQGQEFIATTENPRRDWTEEYIPETDKPQVWAAIHRAIQARSNFELQHRVIRLDGTVGWTFSRAIPLINETGEIVKWFGAASDITEQKQAEVALRVSEAKYRSLFNSIDEGFCLIQVLFDESGKASDYRFLEANPAFEKHTGLVDVIGKTMRELVPQHEAHWLEIYDRIALTGIPERFESAAQVFGRFYDVYAFRMGEPQERKVVALFNDISKRKQVEAQLRRTAEVDALRVKLSDALRSLSDSIEIQAQACRLLGEHLSVDRAYYVEVNEAEGYARVNHDYLKGDAPSLVGVFRLIDYGWIVPFLQRGETIIVADVENSGIIPEADREAMAAIRISAHISTPLIKAGALVGALCVTESAPREWSATEVELVRETAERIWATIERARAEESVRAADARLRAITDATPVLIWETDETGVTFLNQYYLDFFGVSFDTVRETGWARFMHPEDAAGYEAVWREAFGQRQPYSYDCRFLRADGQYRWLRNTGQPMGENRMVGCSLDITESKQAEEDRIRLIREQAAREEERQRAETLTELDRTKTLFFSNVSHEFRTPLTLSLSTLQDALSDRIHPLDPVHKERLELAHGNSLRLLKLVNTLLDFSRIEAGRTQAVYEPTDLALYTTDLASVFRSVIERSGLRLIVDCPPISEAVYVDRQMWEKIVLNLISNAFKFTPKGEIAVRQHLTDDHYVKLQVEDTGIGIPAEELPHVMKRFYQVKRATARTHEGSGIGLALVQELIKMHGGTVEVSSTLGQGSSFTIMIPLGIAHLPSERIQATCTLESTVLGAAPYFQEAERWLPQAVREPAPCGGSLRWGDWREQGRMDSNLSSTSSASYVLVVDDNADMRDYLTRILSEHHEVIAVADGVKALAMVNEQLPDLVLSDVIMPGLDGFELLKALRGSPRTKEVPIILLSARAGEESVIEGLVAGADDYLIKPFSANELVTRVNAYLQMAHLRSEALRFERTINRRKDEALSTVSHELNTPLVAILGWTRLLRSSPFNQAMLMKSLETIERNATLQAKLVQDLLDISRITAGKIHLTLAPVELQQVIENAIATVHQSHQTKDISLDCFLAPSPMIVQGDQERLQQIVLNLLTNAVKFTPVGGRIEIRLLPHENQAQIIISDTGCGIYAELLPHIFDAFRQADGAKKGLGLGLAIARSLVELHSGTISAQSPGIGQGATFIVTIPFSN